VHASLSPRGGSYATFLIQGRQPQLFNLSYHNIFNRQIKQSLDLLSAVRAVIKQSLQKSSILKDQCGYSGSGGIARGRTRSFQARRPQRSHQIVLSGEYLAVSDALHCRSGEIRLPGGGLLLAA
jgi:hypothetical protein